MLVNMIQLDLIRAIIRYWSIVAWEKFSSNYNAEVGWGGMYRGEDVPQGIYIWIIEFKTLIQMKG